MKLLLTILITVQSTFLSLSQLGFTESSNAMGIEHSYTGMWGGGVSFCDFDGDGLDDLSYCTGPATPLIFYKNTGAGFMPITPFVTDTSDVKQINWVDIDNDGDKDLYLSVNMGQSKLYRNEGAMNFIDITPISGIDANNIEAYGSSWADIDNDGDLDFYVSVRDPNDFSQLYRNNGDYTFTNITALAGVEDITTIAFCSVFFDYDNDGDQDFYVATDKVISQNKLYQNNGDGTFNDVSNFSGTGIWIDAMCTTIGDYNRDGYFDIYVTNTPGGNEFFNNNGDGTFTNLAPTNGTIYNNVGWGSQFFDAENDLDLDLYVSGMNAPVTTLSYAFYINDGIGNYSSATTIGFEGDTLSSLGNAMGDFNNDGFVDIATSNGMNGMGALNDSSMFFSNNGNTNNWLKVNLQGTISNRDGIGSKIKINAGGINQYNYTNCGESYLGQNSFNEFFGIGTYTIVDTLTVIWPSGHVDTLLGITPNQTITVIEGQSVIISQTVNVSANPICVGDSALLSIGLVTDIVEWSTGTTADSITVPEGNYWATVTNMFGFSAFSDTVIVEISDIDFDFSSSGISCFGEDNGSIDLSLSGNLPITIVWNGGSTSPILTDLSPGWYVVEATDDNGCIELDSINIVENAELIINAGATPETTGLDGSAWVILTGGTAPFNYFWNDPLAQTTDSITGLAGGEYVVWIVDANNCQDSIHVLVESALGIYQANIDSEISLFPNPAKNQIKIKSTKEISNIRIYNLLGELKMDYSDFINSDLIDISELSNGCYIINVSLDNRSLRTLPFMIIR